MPHIRRRALLAPAIGALAFAPAAAAALAAHPKAGKKYSGFTSAPVFEGYQAPVSFKVSKDGKTLLGFTYGNLGCLGAAGGYGNPYTGSELRNLGKIKVGKKGGFVAQNRKSTTSGAGFTDVLTSSVTGKFKTAKLAKGKIHYTEQLTGNGTSQTCSDSVTFTAKTK